jgi:hypothetical protein
MPASGQLEQNLWRQAQRLDAGELFTLGFADAFERTTLAGLLREDTRIMRAGIGVSGRNAGRSRQDAGTAFHARRGKQSR